MAPLRNFRNRRRLLRKNTAFSIFSLLRFSLTFPSRYRKCPKTEVNGRHNKRQLVKATAARTLSRFLMDKGDPNNNTRLLLSLSLCAPPRASSVPVCNSGARNVDQNALGMDQVYSVIAGIVVCWY